MIKRAILGVLMAFLGAKMAFGAQCDPTTPPTYTPNLGLAKPVINSCSWGARTNANWDIVDSSFTTNISNAILNQSTLQSGYKFYVSSGTIDRVLYINRDLDIRPNGNGLQFMGPNDGTVVGQIEHSGTSPDGLDISASNGIGINRLNINGYDLATHSVFIDTMTVSSATITNLHVTTLSPNQCLQSDANGNVTTSGSACGSGGGGGGTSTLGVFKDGVQITSPTAQINFFSNDLQVIAHGTTSYIALNPATTDFIHNQTTVQSATLNVASGTFAILNSTNIIMSNLKNQGIVGTDATGKIIADPGTSNNYIQNQTSVFQNAGWLTTGLAETTGLMVGGTFYFQASNNIMAGETNSGLVNYLSYGSNIIPSPTGSFDLFAGNSSGKSLTTGVQNSCFGSNSCQTLTTGGTNTAIGYQAASGLTTGSQNTFVGWDSGQGNGGSVTGKQNTGVGYQTGVRLTNGNLNTMVGNGAGNDLTSGVENVCVGDIACNDITTGSSNTAVGFGTVNNNGANTAMTYLGAQASAANTTDILSNGIAIGYGAVVSSSFTAQIGGTVGTGNEVQLEVTSATVNKVLTVQSSFTVTGPGGISDTYGITAGSATINGIGDGIVSLTIAGSTYTVISDSMVPTTIGQCAVFSSTSGTILGQTCSTGGSGTPAGSFNSVQYNNAGSFGGSNNFEWNGTSVTLIASMTVTDTAGKVDANAGQLDVFMQAPVSGQPLFSVGSGNQQNQLVVKDQSPLDLRTYGSRSGNLNIGLASFSDKIMSTNATAQNIWFWNAGEMDLQTANPGDGGTSTNNIVLKPDEIEQLRISTNNVLDSGAGGLNTTYGITAGSITSNGFITAGAFITILGGNSLNLQNPNNNGNINIANTGSSGNGHLIIGAGSIGTNVVGPIIDDSSITIASGGLSVTATGNSSPYIAQFSTSSVNFEIAISTNGHMISNGPAPTISGCGSGPSGSVVGDDYDGVITVGGGSVTACTLTFAQTYGIGCTVACTISDSITTATPDVTTTPTTMTTGFSATIGGGTISYHCIGHGSTCK